MSAAYPYSQDASYNMDVRQDTDGSLRKQFDNSNKKGEMQVRKRNGELQDVSFDKILMRVKNLGRQAGIELNYSALVVKIIEQLFDGIETRQIDDLTAEECASMTTQNPSHGVLAGYVCISNHQKNNSNDDGHLMTLLKVVQELSLGPKGLLSDEYSRFVDNHHEKLEEMIVYDRDFLIDYFGFKTLEKSYLMKSPVSNRIVELPQHMWMRVAVELHMKPNAISNNISFQLKKIKETYDLLSQKYFTHATPTLFNSGTRKPQLSSCYLIGMEEDSIDGIYNTLKDCANISKWAGGIGLHVHNVRAANSPIYGTNGVSTGLVPMLKVFNSTARYCNQGGKRNGSFAIYLEPWHADIENFLQMKRNQGDEEMKARDLFYALWIPDRFMRQVRDDGDWHLFCPNKAKGLSDVHNQDFEDLYERYVEEGKYDRVVSARDLWLKILDTQMETSGPYLLYKDAINRKCNQSNLGTIRSSNLCTEITLYSDDKETAVCNLASVALNMFVKGVENKGIGTGDGGTMNFYSERFSSMYDFEGLALVVRVMVRNLNNVIDNNFYPTDKTRRSNMLHRPIGIGVQGLADCFIKMGYSFDSLDAIEFNKCVFEVIYYTALHESCEIARLRESGMRQLSQAYASGEFTFANSSVLASVTHAYIIPDTTSNETRQLLNQYKPIREELMLGISGSPGAYSSYKGSPIERGILQFDMWENHSHSPLSPISKEMWDSLRGRISMHGIRNSMLLAPMPTASTSQIFGNNECFEPYTNNIYTRRTMAGEFIVMNQHMVKELIEMGIWSEDVKDNILKNNGSVQYLTNLPDDFKRKYRTVWEISMKSIINMARDRGAYICQSQSMNLWVEEPKYPLLTNIHMYSWNQGLKTGMYYMRRKPKHQPQQFTIEPTRLSKSNVDEREGTTEGTISTEGTKSTEGQTKSEEKRACPYRPRGSRSSGDMGEEDCLVCGS